MRGIATERITEYLIGDDVSGYKHYPPQKGQKYRRTGALRMGWIMRGTRTQARAENAVKYSPYVQGTGTQVWWTKKYNWKNIQEINVQLLPAACRAAERMIVKR
jgi:hypothetical protein